MKNISLVVICSIAIVIPVIADARGGKGGGSRSYSKSYSSGYSSASRARGCYGCYDNSYSSSPSTSTYTPSNLSTTTYVIPEVAKYYATTIRKAGVRTCAKHYCTVVRYLPKGTRVTWANSSEGFINMTNSPYWIKSTDLK